MTTAPALHRNRFGQVEIHDGMIGAPIDPAAFFQHLDVYLLLDAVRAIARHQYRPHFAHLSDAAGTAHEVQLVITTYQRRLGLPVTGTLDATTLGFIQPISVVRSSPVAAPSDQAMPSPGQAMPSSVQSGLPLLPLTTINQVYQALGDAQRAVAPIAVTAASVRSGVPPPMGTTREDWQRLGAVAQNIFDAAGSAISPSLPVLRR